MGRLETAALRTLPTYLEVNAEVGASRLARFDILDLSGVPTHSILFSAMKGQALEWDNENNVCKSEVMSGSIINSRIFQRYNPFRRDFSYSENARHQSASISTGLDARIAVNKEKYENNQSSTFTFVEVENEKGAFTLATH